MTVITTTATSQTLAVNGVWDIRVSVLDAHGCAVGDAAPVVTVTLPGGSTATPTVVETRGQFLAEYIPAVVGRFVAHVVDPLYGATDFVAWVQAVTLGTGMPDLDDLDVYLGGADGHSWSDDDLTDALDAEAAAQRAMCRIPAAYTADLRQALLRRCARNLALRRIPLAVLTGDSNGGDSTVLPGRDPEVRRLEAPYRRVTVG